MSTGDEEHHENGSSNGNGTPETATTPAVAATTTVTAVDDLEALFKRYCQLGQGHGSKKHALNQTQMNKMFMDAGIYKAFPKLDRNVLGIYWSYAFKKDKEIEYAAAMEGWKHVFADRYNIDSKGETSKDEFWARFSSTLSNCNGPKLAATKVVSASVMDRLTDESKYTGMHKLRTSQSSSAKKPVVSSSGATPKKPATAPTSSSTSATRTVASAKPITATVTTTTHRTTTLTHRNGTTNGTSSTPLKTGVSTTTTRHQITANGAV